MKRRALLKSVLAGAALLLAPGHTPYRQWVVYRQRHLLILTSRGDGPSYALGQNLAEVLAARLPASQARVVRAPHTARIASLISTKQMDVALMARGDAAALMTGREPFADYGPVPLRAIAGLGDYLLICRDDFPPRHAYLVAETLSAHRDELAATLSPGQGEGNPDAMVPTHPGALAYYQGEPLPEKPGGAGDDG
jgi:TRAP-type uncharacterized transport system substrate-binding protein